MNLATLIRESWAAARNTHVSTSLIVLVVAATCLTGILTVGRQAALEQSIANELSGPAARITSITDVGGEGLAPVSSIDVMATVTGVASVLGRTMPIDVTNAGIGTGATKLALIEVHGSLDSSVDLTIGRLPKAPGEVVVSEEALAKLQMEVPAGYLQAIDGRQWSVVGAFEPTLPADYLQNSAVAVVDSKKSYEIQQITILANSAATASAVKSASLAILDVDPQSVNVSGPSAAANSVRTITDEVSVYGRSLLLLIVGAGSFFVASVVLSDVLVKRKDLGRRRTLGISRSDLVAFVALRTVYPAVFGSAFGSVFAQGFMFYRQTTVPWDFVLAMFIIGVVIAAVASLPPAIYAANRDPVAIMRTP